MIQEVVDVCDGDYIVVEREERMCSECGRGIEHIPDIDGMCLDCFTDTIWGASE